MLFNVRHHKGNTAQKQDSRHQNAHRIRLMKVHDEFDPVLRIVGYHLGAEVLY